MPTRFSLCLTLAAILTATSQAAPENADRHRREYIWPIYLSGGQIEFILEDLLKTKDFLKYETHWKYMARARRLVESQPFWEMAPRRDLLENASGSGNVFAVMGKSAIVYLPKGETSVLDLSEFAADPYTQRWYSPRSDEFVGDIDRIEGGRKCELGSPPAQPGEDWAVLIERE